MSALVGRGRVFDAVLLADNAPVKSQVVFCANRKEKTFTLNSDGAVQVDLMQSSGDENGPWTVIQKNVAVTAAAPLNTTIVNQCAAVQMIVHDGNGKTVTGDIDTQEI